MYHYTQTDINVIVLVYFHLFLISNFSPKENKPSNDADLVQLVSSGL
jgi:hypothetical protein